MTSLLPKTIEVNGKKQSMYDFMLTPCETKEEVRLWIKTFLHLEFPDCTVCEESTSNPLDMIWNVYKAAKDGDPKESSQLYFASRDSFKTLGAAVAELLLMIHFRRTTSHMGAIKQQAKKCYDYLKGFLRSPPLNQIEQLRDTMERTELNLPSPWNMNPYMQIIVCTLAGANCVHPNSNISLKGGKTLLAKNLKKGDQITTYDYLTQEWVDLPVKKISVAPTKYTIAVYFSNGSNLVVSEDHPIFSHHGFVRAANLKIGDKVIVNKSAPHHTSNVEIKDEVCNIDFKSFLIGTLLGDSTLKWPTNTRKNASYGTTYGIGPRFSCSHSLEQYEYLLYKKRILEHNGFKISLIKDSPNNNGQRKISSNVSSEFIDTYRMVYPNISGNTRIKDVTKETLHYLNPQVLAFWYMDDGMGGAKGIGRRKSKRAALATCSFSLKAHSLIIGAFKEKFNINMEVKFIRSQSGKYPILRAMTDDDSDKFYQIIYPYVHYSMRNKLNVLRSFKRDGWCLHCGMKIDNKANCNGFCYCSLAHKKKFNNTRVGRKLLEKIKNSFNGEVVKLEYLGLQKKLIDIEIDTDVPRLKSFVANNILVKNSEHTHLLTIDEVDVVQNVQAYREAKKIPTETPDKKPSITLYISTRKSSFGLVQDEVDRASDTGLQVRSWNIIDVTQACPDSKSKIEDGKVTQYYKADNLDLISEKAFEEIPTIQKAEWEKKEDMYPGCVGCAIAPLCLGRLATEQKSSAALLKSHNDVEKKFRESETDDAIAQLMCLKPSTHGLVFTSFNHEKSVKTPTQMWEVFTGEKASKPITKEELIETFHEYGVPAFCGLDWGWDAPSVALVAFIDKRENIYLVHELAMTKTDDPEFVDIINRRIHTKYRVQMYFPDISNPSGINLLRKIGLPVSAKVDKDIHLGIQTLKRYMKLPGLSTTKFFVLDSMKGFLQEVGKFHLKLDQSGKIISYDEYSDEFDHHIDSIRYVVQSKLGRFRAIASALLTPKSQENPLKTHEGSFTRVPSAQELAQHLGVDNFKDNSDEVQIKKLKGEDEEKDTDSDKTGGDANFTWSF